MKTARFMTLLLLAASLAGALPTQCAEPTNPPLDEAEDTEATPVEVVERLSVNGQVFTNATIMRRSANALYIRHSGGLISLKLSEIDAASLTQLGYEAPKDQTSYSFGFGPFRRTSTGTSTNSAAGPAFGSNMDPAVLLNLGMAFLIGALVVSLVSHLLMSFLFRMICLKTETKPGFLIWLPLLQIVPIFRAAKMSWLWPVGAFALSLAGSLLQGTSPEAAIGLSLFSFLFCLGIYIAWSVRICHARGKSGLLSVLLFLPILNFFTLVYLAVSE